MNVETAFAETIHERQSTSKRETPLPVCCLCGLLRDETRDSLEEERWVTNRTYWNTYGVNAADCLLTLTCCPRCSRK